MKKAVFSTGRIGLGCMGMSEFYGKNDDAKSIETLFAAYEMGYRDFDTADMYGKGHNESLLKSFLHDLGSKRENVAVATKVGIKRDTNGPGTIEVDSRPEYIVKACEASLTRLGVEQIDLCYLHRRQQDVAIEESMGAMKQLMEEGKIASVGLSEMSEETLRRANKVVPISAMQSEYSLWSRDVESEVLPACVELGVKFVAYSPIGRGFLSGDLKKEQVNDPDDLRGKLPRFQDGAFEENQKLIAKLGEVASKVGVSNAQIALAWLLYQSPNVNIIPGARKLPHLQDNFKSQDIVLSPEDIACLGDIFGRSNIVGERYPQALMSTTNA